MCHPHTEVFGSGSFVHYDDDPKNRQNIVYYMTYSFHFITFFRVKYESFHETQPDVLGETETIIVSLSILSIFLHKKRMKEKNRNEAREMTSHPLHAS